LRTPQFADRRNIGSPRKRAGARDETIRDGSRVADCFETLNETPRLLDSAIRLSPERAKNMTVEPVTTAPRGVGDRSA